MSMFEREISPRTAGFCIGVILLVCIAFVVMIGKTASRTPSDVEVSKPKPNITDAAVKITEVSNKTEPAKKAKPADKAVKSPAKEATEKASAIDNPYVIINERNLFRPPTPGAAAGSASSKPAPGAGGPSNVPKLPMPVPSIGPMPPVGNMSVRPMGNPDELKKSIAFTGAVEMPGGTQALLENTSTKEVRFVARGESAFGCRVCDISAQMVSLEKDGMRFNLAIGENKPDVEAGGGGKPGGDQKPPQPEPGKGEPGKGGPPR